MVGAIRGRDQIPLEDLMSTNPTVQTPADLDVQAAAIGREHGTNAATWVEIGSTNAAESWPVLRMATLPSSTR